MVQVKNQNIPSEYLSAYISSLQKESILFAGSVYGNAIYGIATYGIASKTFIRERYPFHLPHMQGGLTLEGL